MGLPFIDKQFEQAQRQGELERARTLDFFGLNLLQDRRPEFYGLLADKDIYYRAEAQPLLAAAGLEAATPRLEPLPV